MPFQLQYPTVFRILGLSGLFLSAALGQTPTYTITTFAGNNTAGYSGDAGAATAAQLSLPVGVLWNGGNVYIADQANQRIRIVGSDGKINTFAGSGVGGYTGDAAKATAATINSPSATVVDPSGAVWISDTNNNVVRKVTKDGNIATAAGNQTNGTTYGGDGGAATNASLWRPSGIAVDSAGNIYIADTSNNRIRKITASSGVITTIVGTGTAGYQGDNGPASRAQINNPVAVAVDSSGNLYIADTGSNVVRKVTGTTITTIAGNGTLGFAGDGNRATFAQLAHPNGVAVDATGNVYIADSQNGRIRMVSTAGTITTIAGTGSLGYSGDAGPALNASLNFPSGICLDGNGNIYVADRSNNVVRLLTPTGSSGSSQPPAVNTGGVVTAHDFGGFSSVAPGTWVEMYGSNLAASTRSWTLADFSNNGQTAPTSLDRTEVTIGGQQASIDYISGGQVNVLVPFVNQGTVPLTVTTAAGTSSTYNLIVDASKFGVYAPSQLTVNGKQYVGAVLANDPNTYIMPPNSVSGFTSRQAHPGETITIYGVGFGPVNTNTFPGQAAPGSSTLSGSLQISFGGTPAQLSYWGLAPGSFGLYQFNVIVPAIPANDAVPVTITLNGAAGSQTLYTAVQ